MKLSSYVFAALLTAMAVLLQACAPEIKPQESCNFVQNSMLQRVSWGNQFPVKMYIHNSVQDSSQVEAIESAARRWNEILGREAITIQAAYVSGDINAKKEGRSFIYMLNEWEPDRPTEQARTTIYWSGNRINEADIKINAKNFRYSTDTNSKSSAVDLESLMIHEMGHVLGLAHLDHSKSVMATTLPTGSLRREISDQDKSNLACEYTIDSSQMRLAGN